MPLGGESALSIRSCKIRRSRSHWRRFRIRVGGRCHRPDTPQQAAPKPASAQTAKSVTPPTQLPPPRMRLRRQFSTTKDVETILGREIYSIAGEDMGRIVDILVDHKGNVRAALIDFGGFLGVGSARSRSIGTLSNSPQDRALLSLVRDQVRVAPEYRDGEPVVVLGSPSPAAPQQPHAPRKGEARGNRPGQIAFTAHASCRAGIGIGISGFLQMGGPVINRGETNAPHPSRKSLAGLDWFTFFLADVQTGFGALRSPSI